jgi:endonuclease/exonuclease/phosphatase family metal-dependent hydrolase
VAWILGRLGLSLTFPADHFFIDTKTAEEHVVESRILPSRVSDHLPITLELR